MMDPRQLRDDIIRPALQMLGEKYADERAVTLLLATAAQESHCGHYVRQIGGPALGYLQIEPATLRMVGSFASRANLRFQPGGDPERLVWDWRYSTMVGRLLYWSWPDALPAPNVNDTWAAYKKMWNSELGKATFEQWHVNWLKYVRPVL